MEQRALWPGGPLYAGDPVGGDSLALAYFAGGTAARTGCDLGCGSGILLLLLCRAAPELRMDGIELRPRAAAMCRANLETNGLAHRCRVFTGDLRDRLLPAGSVELAVSNPPYFPAGAGAVSPDPDRAMMRTESAALPDLCAAAARLLVPGGAFCLVHRTERMEEVFAALREAGLEPKRRRFFMSRAGKAPELFLLEARKGGAPGLVTEPDLIQFGPDGTETDEYRTITHWEA